MAKSGGRKGSSSSSGRKTHKTASSAYRRKYSTDAEAKAASLRSLKAHGYGGKLGDHYKGPKTIEGLFKHFKSRQQALHGGANGIGVGRRSSANFQRVTSVAQARAIDKRGSISRGRSSIISHKRDTQYKTEILGRARVRDILKRNKRNPHIISREIKNDPKLHKTVNRFYKQRFDDKQTRQAYQKEPKEIIENKHNKLTDLLDLNAGRAWTRGKAFDMDSLTKKYTSQIGKAFNNGEVLKNYPRYDKLNKEVGARLQRGGNHIANK